MSRTTTRQRQTSEQQFVPVDASVTFRDGLMLVGGAPQRPNRVVQWESSNGITNYSCVEWIDPATGNRRTSCNCPGWAIKKAGRDRQCTHTLDMEGRKTCTRKRVDTTQIRSAAQAAAVVPDLVDGRELRSIMVD